MARWSGTTTRRGDWSERSDSNGMAEAEAEPRAWCSKATGNAVALLRRCAHRVRRFRGRPRDDERRFREIREIWLGVVPGASARRADAPGWPRAGGADRCIAGCGGRGWTDDGWPRRWG